MEIQSVEVIPLEHLLGEDRGYGGARGITHNRTATIVKLTTDNGLVGIGEAFAPPLTVATLIEEVFSESLVGRSPWEANSLADEVYTGQIGGYHFGREGFTQAALTGIEVAMWDLQGKILGQPVKELLGGPTRNSVTPYASTMYFTEWDQDPAEPIRDAVNEGFTAAKIKIGKSIEDDIRRVKTARETLGDDAHLMVDYNGNYTPTQALKSIREIEEYDITWVEEPVPPENVDGYQRIQNHIDIPLAAGEAHFGRFEFTRLIEKGVVDIIQPNLGRCGGFAEAEYIAQSATTQNIRVRPHVWNSGIGLAAALQFAATVPTYPERSDLSTTPVLFEVDRSENPLRTEILKNNLDLSGDTLTVPDSPGLGIELDDEAVDCYKIE